MLDICGVHAASDSPLALDLVELLARLLGVSPRPLRFLLSFYELCLDVVQSRIRIMSARHTCQVFVASTDLSIALRFGAMCSISALTFEIDSSSSFNASAEPS